MLKKSIVIILTALMLCAAAACQKANNGEGTAEASIVVSETSEASKSESEWVNPFENSDNDFGRRWCCDSYSPNIICVLYDRRDQLQQ